MAKASGQKNGKGKTVCPVSLEQFERSAKPLVIKIGDQALVANVKAPFSTGSFGWNANGPITIEVDGVPLKVMAGINLTVANSKPE